MAQLEHIEAIEKRLWRAADTLRANSTYASNEYFLPVCEVAPNSRTLQVLILTAILRSKGVFHDQERESQEEPYWTSYLQ